MQPSNYKRNWVLLSQQDYYTVLTTASFTVARWWIRFFKMNLFPRGSLL